LVDHTVNTAATLQAVRGGVVVADNRVVRGILEVACGSGKALARPIPTKALKRKKWCKQQLTCILFAVLCYALYWNTSHIIKPTWNLPTKLHIYSDFLQSTQYAPTVAEQLKVEQDTPQRKFGTVTNWEFKHVTEVLAVLCGKTANVSQLWERDHGTAAVPHSINPIRSHSRNYIR
jgi:hypothetical protein